MNTPSNYRPIEVGDTVTVDGENGYIVLTLPDKHGYWTLTTTGWDGAGNSVTMVRASRVSRYKQ